MKKDFENIAIIIPALNPNEGIVKLIEKLSNYNFKNIFVIDDGSNQESQRYFQKVVQNFNITLLKHDQNFGKGCAIKTGIRFILDKKFDGVITVDADGQHLAEDVKKVAQKMNNKKIIFGVRDFKNKKKVPLGSIIGNKFSSWYLKLITGKYLEDTQTGLRGIPSKYFNMALNTKGNRYDYEMNFLKQICLKKAEIEEVEIETIYKDRVKNFRIIKDSYIIYKEFFRNLISSMICAVVDVIAFWILFLLSIHVFWTNILARIISGIVDFVLNKKWVFSKGSSNEVVNEFIKYLILFMIQMLLNSFLIWGLSKLFREILLLKVIINIILYFINFFIKKRFIFKEEILQ